MVVRLPPRALTDGGLDRHAADALRASGLPAHLLTLVEPPAAIDARVDLDTAAMLATIRAMGVQVVSSDDSRWQDLLGSAQDGEPHGCDLHDLADWLAAARHDRSRTGHVVG